MGDAINLPPAVERCAFCKRRPATRICDMPVGHTRHIGHPPRGLMLKAQKANNAFVKVEMEHTITCDAPMCDECATRIWADIDLCPSCKKKLKGAIR